MDRFALVVDAGYLLMAGGKLCLGVEARRDAECDYSTLHPALVTLAENDCGLTHLRTYWYDGAPGTPPQLSTEQLKVTTLRGVKLRLGRVIRGQQKGVDSLITLDLLTLARERAVSVIYLLSGDEDLREGVVAAQGFGVRVILLGIPGSRTNQSFTLINECDDHLVPDQPFWQSFFKLSEPEQVVPDDALALTPNLPEATPEQTARAFGIASCENWLASADAETVELVRTKVPFLPKDIDAPLMRAAEQRFGSLKEQEPLRQLIRTAFVERLSGIVPADD